MLTAFDQLRDSQRHQERSADDAQDRQIPLRRCTTPRRRATSQPRPSNDDVQSSIMPSSTMSSQSAPPVNVADDCQRCLNADPPSSLSLVPSSSSSSSTSQFHHLCMPQLASSTSTPTVAVDWSTSDSVATPSDDANCRLLQDSSDDCRSPTPPPPISFCAVSSSAATTGSSNESRVVAELVDTERKYVRDLRQIIDVSSSFAVQNRFLWHVVGYRASDSLYRGFCKFFTRK